MSRIIITEPEATENLIENPSFEFAITDWNIVGCALTRTIERARFGTASGMVVTAGAALNEGIYYRIDPQTQGEFYAGSAYVRGQGLLRVRIRDAANGYHWASDPVAVNDLRWIRISVIGQTRGNVSNDLRIYIETAERIQAVTFYVDGAQIENKDHATTYCDGDLENDVEPHQGDMYFRWEGPRHGSVSKRSARYAAGGRLKSFDEIDVNIYPIRAGGLGMGDIRHGVVSYSDQLRSVVRSWKPQPKAVYLEFWAREDEKNGTCSPASLMRLHKARAELETVLKPDRVPDVQPVSFLYEDGDRAVEFRGFYETGLEFDGDLRFPWYSNFPIRLLCPDPFVWEDTQDMARLVPGKGLLNCNYIVARIGGEWVIPGGIGCAGGYPIAIRISPNGDVYMGGGFTSVGLVAGTKRVARWDGDRWIPLGNGIDDGYVRDIAFGADGIVYVVGQFSNIDAAAYNNVARYDPTTNTWATMGPQPGLSNWARGVCITDDGQVWIAGGFSTEFGGGQALNYATRYDPDVNAFSPLTGAPGFNGASSGVVADLDGYNLYFCGSFTNHWGGAESAVEGVCRYNRDTNSFEACGTGVDVVINTLYVRKMILTESGKLYIIGEIDHAGYMDVAAVAMFNRQEWYPLGQEDDGLLNYVAASADVDADPSRKGYILFVGEFTGATGSDLSRAATLWNGSKFSHLDIKLPTAHKATCCAFKGDDIWIGHYRVGNADASYITTVTNRGKATAKPVLEVLGPALIEWLENQTTGEVVKIDCEILAGERVMFDFREGLEKVRSSIKGNIPGVILPGSDSFQLLPGDNRIAIFCEGTNSDTEITLRWQIRHWGFDGVA